MDESGTERLLKYLQGAVQYENGVASFQLCQDSQTRWLIDKLGELNLEKIELLDYGCGQLRLLNAVKKSGLLSKIKYSATDICPPTLSATEDLPFVFRTPLETKSLSAKSLDVAVIMNVVHEIPLLDFAHIVETVRRLLKDTGKFLIVDMAVLPEGEFRSLPYYPFELKKLFFESNDCSYTSKSGVPVVALEIPSTGIPIYPQFRQKLRNLVSEKRDSYCDLACSLHLQKINPRIRALLEHLSLNHGDAHDLGYLMLMSGFANYRLIEDSTNTQLLNNEIEDAAEAVLRWFFEYCKKNGKLPLYHSVFDSLGCSHTYDALVCAVLCMSNHIGAFFFPMRDENLGNAQFKPSESIEAFEDHFDYDDIRKLGLSFLQAECHQVKWPD